MFFYIGEPDRLRVISPLSSPWDVSTLKITEVRRLALALPGATEEPHFDKSSFRVKGKIFATVPPGGNYLHVFVDEAEQERMVSVAPKAYEKLWWGKKVVGLRVALSLAKSRDVADLLRSAWERKAPKNVTSKRPSA